jgi:hypothetical protein
MSKWVQATNTVGSDGWVVGHLTNTSLNTLYVSYTFGVNGVPRPSMRNAGATTIQPGQTVGGELGGLYSTNGDGGIYSTSGDIFGNSLTWPPAPRGCMVGMNDNLIWSHAFV